MAHPDDVEFFCAGTLIRLARMGWTIHIATATPGDCGTMTANRWSISATRTAEAAAAAVMIGATYHCLDERDGMVVYDKPTVQKTIDLFRRIAPMLVFTHAPKDYMMDHEMVSLLARAGSFMYGAPNISALPRLDNSVVPHLYYCDPSEGIDPLGRTVEPTTLIDISQEIETKARMLACHDSQRQWLRTYHGMEYIEAMKRHGAARGKMAGVGYAEAFVQHRGHAYPHDDLLGELLGKQQDTPGKI
ncbi:MAG: PIG-L family deacetylase [Phycisphaerae bacterium]|nr:PIG-L family deacetylase [Phycisphaerae bacterium]